MSDFLFSSSGCPDGELSTNIKAIYYEDPPDVEEFHGQWGSLAVSANPYSGFRPVETAERIFAVIGGPVLSWRDNHFLMEKDSQRGTQCIADRWLAGDMEWANDLHGPFVVILVDKVARTLSVVTDLLMFIPVYEYKQDCEFNIGTHVDALANISSQRGQFDQVSLVDFILNAAITYPFTAYERLRQGQPACETIYEMGSDCESDPRRSVYWQPLEENCFETIDQAAEAIRDGMTSYIERVTEGMTEVGQFISGGEDTRVVSALLPQRLKRNAFIFVDSLNREWQIASAVASAYGSAINVETRGLTHYVALLPQATTLIGSGHPYAHAHTLGFHKKCGLTNYPAVFGGYLADSFLKGLYANKPRIVNRFSFIPDFLSAGETRSAQLKCSCFDASVLDVISQRRRAHLESIQQIRPESAHEWFAMYPATMMITIPNVYTNRRLFCSYEPFMCNEVIKIGAAVPISWKLNRRLFNRFAKPLFRKTRWVSHTTGHLPYFSWWINVPIQFVVWLWLKFARAIGLHETLQGPWADWRKVMKGDEWREAVEKVWPSGKQVFGNNIKFISSEDFLNSTELSYSQRICFLQTLYNVTDCGADSERAN